MPDYTKMSDSELLKLYEEKKALQGYPAGSVRLPNGAVGQITGSGSFRAYPGQGNVAASPEIRARVNIGLAPSIAAERNLETATRARGEDTSPTKNPLSTFRGGVASILAEKESPTRNWAAQVIGGQEFQNINQSSKTFESSFTPILSGAQVTESEAQRLIRATLPQPGNSPETLRRKEINRQLMINSAAEMSGKPKPYPNVGSIDLKNREQIASAFPSAITASKPAALATALSATAPKPEHIQILRQRPETAPQFDRRYGAGAAARYLNQASTPSAGRSK
jgi:hypothetical protein